MMVVGLTGGIASGKSTVSRFLSAAGAHIIDADRVAREVVEKGSAAYREIVNHFGEGVLLADGAIDRAHLGDLIFNDAQSKSRLDAIVHPRVYEQTERKLARIAERRPDALVVMDIPLLFETGNKMRLKEVIVVYVPESVQLARLMRRDGIDAVAAMARIRSQMPIEEKRRRATIVIDNSRDLETTRRQALTIFHRLKQMNSV